METQCKLQKDRTPKDYAKTSIIQNSHIDWNNSPKQTSPEYWKRITAPVRLEKYIMKRNKSAYTKSTEHHTPQNYLHIYQGKIVSPSLVTKFQKSQHVLPKQSIQSTKSILQRIEKRNRNIIFTAITLNINQTNDSRLQRLNKIHRYQSLQTPSRSVLISTHLGLKRKKVTSW